MTATDPLDPAPLDAADELAGFAREFLPYGPDVRAYLDGNSLGRPPAGLGEALSRTVTQDWGQGLIRSWDAGWLQLPQRLGDRIGEVALGAAPGQLAVADSTTVNLFKLLHAAVAMRAQRSEIVCDVTNFPTDRYLVEAVAQQRGLTVRWLEPDPDTGVTVQDLAAVLGDLTAVVTLSHVDYRSAAIADMAGITAAVQQAGALMVWDLCHSVGVVPVELDACGADFAVGCCYKFLCGGPGAPAFGYIARRHLGEAQQPIWGWIGRQDPFAMAPGYQPAAGITSMLSGTPTVLGLIGVQCGLDLVARAGIGAIRGKSIALTGYAITLYDALLAPKGFRLGSPRDPQRRGGHITVHRHDAELLTGELIGAGVIPDFRTPDGIRLGVSPMSTSFAEVATAVRTLAELS